jgi:hypothetical protein
VAYRLQVLRVRMPAGAWMFMLCVVQSGQRNNTDDVQRGNPAASMDVCLLQMFCVVR